MYIFVQLINCCGIDPEDQKCNMKRRPFEG